MKKSLHILNNMINFNEIFRKNATYDNIKIHQKSGLLPLSRENNFRKTTGGFKLTPSHTV